MKKIIRLMVFVLIGILSIGALGSCNKEQEPDQPEEDYSNLTFAEVFEIQEDKNAGMPGMTMAQLTSTNSSSAYPAKTHHIFYLKAKYDVEIKGVSFSMKPEKEAKLIHFEVFPVPRNGTYIFQTGSDSSSYESISTGSNAISKTYSFTYTLKKGNSIGFNSILAEREMGWIDDYFINATFYNFKLNFTVVQNN